MNRTTETIVASFIFWILQILYHLSLGINGAVISGSAFTGAVLIGLSMIAGPLSRLSKINIVAYRRNLGVIGFVFALIHVAAVISLAFSFNLSYITSLISPLGFGLMAFILFAIIAATSNDYMLKKLNYNKWKTIQRLSYIAFILIVIHFLTTNTAVIFTPPGYILLAVIILVFSLEMAEFFAYKKSLLGRTVGYLIIIAGAFLLYTQSGIGFYVIIVSVVIGIIFYISKKKNTETKVIQSHDFTAK